MNLLKRAIFLIVPIFPIFGWAQQASSPQTDSAEYGKKATRMSDIEFQPQLQNIAKGDIQYFYSLTDLDWAGNTGKLTPHPESNWKNKSPGVETIAGMDYYGFRQKDVSTGSDTNYHVLIFKWTTVVNKTIEFIRSHYSDVNFQHGIHTKSQYSLLMEPTSNHIRFHMIGSDKMPNDDLDIMMYDLSESQPPSDTGVQEVLSLDKNLGRPQFLLTEYYYNFSRVLRVLRSSKFSRAIMKFYKDPEDPQRTIIVNYTMSYVYNLPSDFWQDDDLLRVDGVGFIKEGMKYIDDIP